MKRISAVIPFAFATNNTLRPLYHTFDVLLTFKFKTLSIFD